MKISYGILVHNEVESLRRLLDSIINAKKDYEWEIVIVYDWIKDNNLTENIFKEYREHITLCMHALKNDFARAKNYMTERCSGDWIMNPDADELFPDYLLENAHLIIEQNNTECIWVPRINTVEGLTSEWAQKFGFKIFPDVSKAAAPINEKVMDTESGEYKLLKKLGLVIEEIPIK